MRDRLLRVAAIQDLSSFGRCSLSVILPILSVMGVQCCPLPTAVLSTHTGGFGPAARQELPQYLSDCLAHYKGLSLAMDCIYTGYLSSPQQAEDCLSFFHAYPKALKMVDPVMGDGGKLYHSFTPQVVAAVSSLVAQAQVITPNLTEARILLGEEPSVGSLSAAKARELLKRLSALGPGRVVLTGVTLVTGEYGNICYDRQQNDCWMSTAIHFPVSYPGAGDVFAAVLLGRLLGGDSLAAAMSWATSYLATTIQTTYENNTDAREGLLLEKTLSWLTRSGASTEPMQL